MCGIAGQVGRLPTPNQQQEARGALLHRGPDGNGIHISGQAALIHTRLAIIDLSDGGAQPMVDSATGVTILLNGEIYNFRQLRRDLGDTGFRSNSDTEVVLKLYLHHGTDAFARLRGMFAVAIWDPREQTLHLARDPFGIKPLLIHQDGEVLRFASEAKALHALGAPRQLNLSAVRSYLEEGRQNHGRATFFAGIESLPAAHVLTWQDGRVSSLRSYWSIEPRALPANSDSAIEDALWEGFLDSLEHHLVADVPVGVSLSSGLDSQLVTRGLAELRRRGRADAEIHTFTFGFQEAEYDEIRRVETVDFGLPLIRHGRVVTPDECIPALTRAVGIFETPLGGLGSVGSFLLMEMARSKGIKVLLSGEGSDETFGGYRYYHYVRLRELAESGDHAALERELKGWAQVSGEALAADTPEFRARVFPKTRTMRAPDGTSLGGEGFLGSRLREVQPVQPYTAPTSFGPLRKAMLEDLIADKLPKLLWFQDRASMAHGVETRVPFLDRVLFSLALSLPSEWLIRDGVAKFALKRLLRRFCGVDAFGPAKHYVATPQREWLKGPLYSHVLKWLDEGILARSGLIDYPAFRAAYAAYAAAPALGNSFFIWKMMDLEALLREMFPRGV